jgi:hypothetical protein
LVKLEKLENLEETNDLSGDDYSRKSTIQYLLMEIYGAEEKMWRERSSEKWLLFGDNNSSYFNKIANGSKKILCTLFKMMVH